MSRRSVTAALAISTAMLTACTTVIDNLPTHQTCLEPGSIQTRVLAMKAADFEPRSDTSYAEMANLLVACLGAPDPQIRDDVAYAGLTHLLRGKLLTANEMRGLKQPLMRSLSGPDPDGYRRPFTALVLSEIIRADRVAPYLSDTERDDILNAGLTYLSELNDYRGFDDTEGWRHGTAHGADLLMQITLNPAFTRADHLQILGTIGLKMRVDSHAYIFGEGERLTRPVLFIARANTLTAEDWSTWFEGLADPAPLTSWGEAFSSEAALTRLHNLKYTLYPMLIQVQLAAQRQTDPHPLLTPLLEAVKKLP